MSCDVVRFAMATAVALLPNLAGAQHEEHSASNPQAENAELMRCVRVQPVIQNIIGAAARQAEAARLSNSPSELRAALDHLEAALRDIRVQSEPCGAAAAAGVPHAGPTMPSTPSGSPSAPAQPPVGAPDPHAGHSMPGLQAPAAKAPTPAPVGGDDPHAGHAAAQPGADEQKIEAWLKAYDVAFLAKDLDKLATFYHPDVTIFEGTGVNNGWVDYRDHHLGPELKMFEDLQFGHANRRVVMLGERSAYVASEYFIKAKMKDRMLDNIGRETLVLEEAADGTWKIRHSHTSGRARPQK